MRYVVVGVLFVVYLVALLAPIAIDARRWFPKRREQKPEKRD